jgi:hypothetical protein
MTTSTAERPDEHPGQEGVPKQQHRPLLPWVRRNPWCQYRGGIDIGDRSSTFVSTEPRPPWYQPRISTPSW